MRHSNRSVRRTRLLAVGAVSYFSAVAHAANLTFITTGTFSDYVPTAAPGPLTGTNFQLTWVQGSDPAPYTSMPNQTFIGNVSGTYLMGGVASDYPTGAFYPRFYTTSGGGGYLFDAYLNGDQLSGDELFLFFGSPQLFTGSTASPHFSTGIWLGDGETNIIYGTDPNNRYDISNAVLTIQDTETPEPETASLVGMAAMLLLSAKLLGADHTRAAEKPDSRRSGLTQCVK